MKEREGKRGGRTDGGKKGRKEEGNTNEGRKVGILLFCSLCPSDCSGSAFKQAEPALHSKILLQGSLAQDAPDYVNIKLQIDFQCKIIKQFPCDCRHQTINPRTQRGLCYANFT